LCGDEAKRSGVNSIPKDIVSAEREQTDVDRHTKGLVLDRFCPSLNQNEDLDVSRHQQPQVDDSLSDNG